LVLLFITGCGSKEVSVAKCDKIFIADGRSTQTYLINNAYGGQDLRKGFCIDNRIEE